MPRPAGRLPSMARVLSGIGADARRGRQRLCALAGPNAWILLRARGTGAVVESPDEGERHIGEDMAVKWKKETLLPMQIWPDIIKGGTPATAEEIKSLADKVAALVESNKNRP